MASSGTRSHVTSLCPHPAPAPALPQRHALWRRRRRRGGRVPSPSTESSYRRGGGAARARGGGSTPPSPPCAAAARPSPPTVTSTLKSLTAALSHFPSLVARTGTP
eukprot:2798265-Rhodomonas_salina.2